MKDSGERQNYINGAVREPTDNKGRFDLLPFLAMIELAKCFEKGAVKYAPRNWEKGIPLSRYLDSCLRHTIQFAIGMEDEEHLNQAVWNLIALLETKIRIEKGLLPEELNDIPSEFFKTNKDNFELFGDMFYNNKG